MQLDIFAETGEVIQMAQMKNNNGCNECCMAGGNENKTTDRDQKLKDSLITRLNRVEGQVRGIRGMIERDVYCNDVLIQIAAAQAALDSVSKLVLENHIRGCLVKRIQAGDDKIIDELLVTIGKML
jgi:DNA-binding FrmR family transcriptional regulator